MYTKYHWNMYTKYHWSLHQQFHDIALVTRKTSLATTKNIKLQDSWPRWIHISKHVLSSKTSWFSSHMWLLALGFKINICVLMIFPILLAESKVLLVQSLCLAVEPHFPFHFFRVKPVNPFTPNCLMAMFDYQRIKPLIFDDFPTKFPVFHSQTP